MIRIKEPFSKIWILLALISLVWPATTLGQRPGQIKPLWFSLQPDKAGGPPAGSGQQHSGRPGGKPSGRPAGKPQATGGKPQATGGKPQGADSGRPSGGRPSGSSGSRYSSRFESEHRATPSRKYYLHGGRIAEQAEGFILHADRSVSDLPMDLGEQTSVSVNLPMGDGLGSHGANNVYAVDRQVVGETLHIRNAKWVTIHHSCGWGHGPKFDEPRQMSQSLDQIPLEIVVEDLWDTNFHSTVMSGDMIHIRVLHFGKPAVRAKVTVISEKGWQKTLTTDDSGKAQFQLVRDYYPESWSVFHRTEKGRVKFLAEYGVDESGQYQGQAFKQAKYSATFPWRYYPAQREYTSLMIGLLVVLFGAGFTGMGVFIYRQRRQTGLKKLVFHE